MKIELQAARVLYDQRCKVLKDRFGDVYSMLLNTNKGDVSKTEEQLLTYASNLVQGVKDAKAYLSEQHAKEQELKGQEP